MTLWKDVERRVARELGGQRVPGSHGPDVIAGNFIVEVKHRKKLPEWLKSALKQATSNAGEGQLGLLVLHEKYQGDSLLVMSLNDFTEWFGG